MGSAPIIGVAAVAATVGILFLILFDFVREVWLACPAWIKFSLVSLTIFISLVVVATAS